MYYVAGVGWRHRDLPRYNIQYATSRDGLHWHRDGTVAIDFASDAENALARPFVLKEDGRYRMWFRSEEHTSALQSLMRISYAVFCLEKNTHTKAKTVYRQLHVTTT